MSLLNSPSAVPNVLTIHTTRFFDTVTQSDDDDDVSTTADIESILGLFLAQNAPDRMFRWHYRSRHESLIAVSNLEFYRNGLVVFPSPDAGREEVGLKYIHLPDTVYDRGSSATNRKEAEVVAAFSVGQMRAILDRLELLRRQDPSNESFFNAHPHEPFFVKNLENVQGDERDVIFISVGYGRDANGRVTMNFGPLSSDGGERRLNVLITRARRRCEVFTNLSADDVDTERTTSRGARVLKTYLAYAEHGMLQVPVESQRDTYSPFQEAVATELSDLGYKVRQEVGSGGYFIDLAIVDPERPGRYLIGIECDGPSYHSSRSARDRDRLREQVLTGLGWHIHHIWSTDWFRNPDRELKRAVVAIEHSKTYRAAAKKTPDQSPTAIERTTPVQAQYVVPQYTTANLQVTRGAHELHTVPRATLSSWVIEVVDVESPVHISEVARRIADAAGVMRIGHRIQTAMGDAIKSAIASKRIRRSKDFLWRYGMREPPLRHRTNLSASSKKLDFIAPEEIAIAVQKVVTSSFGINRHDAPTAVGRLLGFKRVTDETRSGINNVVRLMLKRKALLLQGDHLVINHAPKTE